MFARERPAKALLAGFAVILMTAAALASVAPGGPQKKKKTSEDKDPQAQYEMGVIALRYGLPDEAVRYGNLAVALDPNFFNAWNLLGNAYYAKTDFAQSAEAYTKAAALKPDNADVQRGLGLSLVEIKETARAEEALKRSLALDGAFESAFYLGKLCYGERRYDEALDYAVKAIQKNGKNAGAYNLKGVVLNQLSRFAEAAGSFQAGLVIAPGDVNLQINLGIALFNSGESTKARGVFEAVLPKIEQDTLRKQVEDYIKAIKDAGK
jgi:tetratricopeptide (TPR) repeat protein